MPPEAADPLVGQVLSHYEILERLGAGGMGVLYRARDTRLDRTIALKLLRPEMLGDAERRRRFIQEARAASALNHPGIVTVHEIDHDPATDTDFIAMELVEGQSLERRLARSALPLPEGLRLACDIAEALAAAHAAGIVHRDVKPANVMVTRSDRIKVLDFGLAKQTLTGPPRADEASGATVTTAPRTVEGVILGTPAYMSPEQAQGHPVDVRSDVFSLGVVLYEMLAGRRPFAGESHVAVLGAILHENPPLLRQLRREVPADLERVVERCLRKDPARRYDTALALRDDLLACRARFEARRSGWRALLHRPAFLVAAALLLAAAVAGAARLRERRAREAVGEVARLAEDDLRPQAFRLARDARAVLSDDPQLERLWQAVSLNASIRSEPPGAEIWFKPYDEPEAEWQRLGAAPFDGPAPGGNLRVRFVKDGFETVEEAVSQMKLLSSLHVRLTPSADVPAGMVAVPGGPFQYRFAREARLDDFWLDRHEVTNRQFKEFVDKGGYKDRRYWREVFREDGRTLAWEDAMVRFRDATGRPGPAGWELGTYPEGRAQEPVGGVSWYEAAAYAEYSGRRLPTLLHWYKAAEPAHFSEILLFSNFSGEGPSPVGERPGLGPYGTYDMAGNVREWSATAAGEKRYALGGSWNDPTYLYTGPDALPPFERPATVGLRCALYPRPPSAEASAPVEVVFPDRSREQPVSDEVFAAFRRLYSYDRSDLSASAPERVEETEHWVKERLSFAAAYGGERIPAYLFLPRSARPPYQTIVYFPSGGAAFLPSGERLGLLEFGYVVRSGRAVLFPVYKGTYERGLGRRVGGPGELRDLVVQAVKDLGRALDYLETRPDLDRSRIAFLGRSLGADIGVLVGALDPRLRTLVLLGTGLRAEPEPPEIERLNFAPRVKMPVLMINGRDDFMIPHESSQEPLFRLLGTLRKTSATSSSTADTSRRGPSLSSGKYSTGSIALSARWPRPRDGAATQPCSRWPGSPLTRLTARRGATPAEPGRRAPAPRLRGCRGTPRRGHGRAACRAACSPAAGRRCARAPSGP
ncbi:MAG: protein kinase [Acidobacteria bacterium]|nr:protein kinase [Acidobacteriota bacterium]